MVDFQAKESEKQSATVLTGALGKGGGRMWGVLRLLYHEVVGNTLRTVLKRMRWLRPPAVWQSFQAQEG